ncbi:MAG: glycosyltransferase family 2 protein [Bacilli bacterium]|nr:glycosyltransferase family 2 protein [Bacilli bacterium]
MADLFNTLIEKLKGYFFNLFGLDLLIEALEENKPVPAQAWLNLFFSSIATFLSFFVIYQTIYFVIGLFGKARSYKEMPKDKRYALITAGRNEEKVIANFVESCLKQDYPMELIDVYVIAHNCTDKTAELARNAGANVIEYTNFNEQRKGYALKYFFEYLKNEKNIDIQKEYYAFILFDADNVLAPDYVSKMNNCLQDQNYDASISYPNVKNMSEHWVAAMSGIHLHEVSVTNGRPRSIFNSSNWGRGCGMAFRSHVLKDGWKWLGLTEDADVTMEIGMNNQKVGYCEEAEFYDEQPTKFHLFVRQRLRWSRGRLWTFWHYSGDTLKSFFKKPSWSKYDYLCSIFPRGQILFFNSILFQILSIAFFLTSGDHGYNWDSFLNFIIMNQLISPYVGSFFYGLVVIVREHKRVHLTWYQSILYLLLYPIAGVVGKYLDFAAIFIPVKWKAIPHHVVADAGELKAQENR